MKKILFIICKSGNKTNYKMEMLIFTNIQVYTNKILQHNLVAKVMTTLTFQFPTGNFAFNKSDIIITKIKRITNLTLKVIVSYFQFYLKFKFNITLININTTVIVTKTISFPDHVLSIKNKNFIQVFKSLNGLFNYLKNASLQEDTKKKL